MKLEWSQENKSANNFYRIGDSLLLKDADLARRQMMHNPNTIGYDYLSRAEKNRLGDKLDVPLLNAIIDEHILKNKYSTPNDEAIIHWRLYPKSPVNHQVIEQRLTSFSGKKIVVVAAMKDGSTRGRESEIFDFIRKHNAVLKSSKTPDEDFCYCVKAKNFISTIGNFSRLIYMLNTGNKEMYSDKFYNDDYIR